MKVLIAFLCILFASLFSSIALASVIPEQEIISYLQENSVPYPEVILAIIRVESSCNSKAQVYDGGCKCNTYGMMQLQYDTARTMGFRGAPRRLLDWKENVTYGSRYLLSKISEYQDIPTAISAYNAGRALVRCSKCTTLSKKFGNHVYVQKVLKEMEKILEDDALRSILKRDISQFGVLQVSWAS